MLQAVNNHITELQGKKAEHQDVLELLPVQLFFGQWLPAGHRVNSYTCIFYTDEQFYRYLTLSNERIAHFMILSALNMEKYFINPSVSQHCIVVIAMATHEMHCIRFSTTCMFQLLPNEAPLLLRKGTLEILHLMEP